jgi:ATP-dependent helicase HrpB
LPLIDRFDRQPFHVKRVAEELQRLAANVLDRDRTPHLSEEELRRALFAGYADRVAKRRAVGSDRFTLASGHGASLARESGVRDGEYVVALHVVAAEREGIAESRIRVASLVDREWLSPTSIEVEHRFDAATGRVKAARVSRYDAIVLNDTPVPPDSALAAPLLRDAWLARESDPLTLQLLRRLRFAGIDIAVDSLVEAAAASAEDLDDIDLEAQLPFNTKRELDRQAPESLLVPSGRSTPLTYAEDGSVSASVKLQELFGLADSPVLGPNRVPVIFHLLAPNGRPVQTTRDLRSFWHRTYQEVRSELRGRYPKHPWPDDPWTAQATHRTIRRSR